MCLLQEKFPPATCPWGHGVPTFLLTIDEAHLPFLCCVSYPRKPRTPHSICPSAHPPITHPAHIPSFWNRFTIFYLRNLIPQNLTHLHELALLAVTETDFQRRTLSIFSTQISWAGSGEYNVLCLVHIPSSWKRTATKGDRNTEHQPVAGPCLTPPLFPCNGCVSVWGVCMWVW